MMLILEKVDWPIRGKQIRPNHSFLLSREFNTRLRRSIDLGTNGLEMDTLSVVGLWNAETCVDFLEEIVELYS